MKTYEDVIALPDDELGAYLSTFLGSADPSALAISVEQPAPEIAVYRREHIWEGNRYVIRDIREPSPLGRSVAGRFIRCEYATKDDAGVTIWTPCQGVDFSDIKPFEPAASVAVVTASVPELEKPVKRIDQMQPEDYVRACKKIMTPKWMEY